LAKPGTTIAKREKEKARQQKAQDKGVRKAETRERRSKGREWVDGVDPDIAGLIAGPQPEPPERTIGLEPVAPPTKGAR
jgi:hypothetical protein